MKNNKINTITVWLEEMNAASFIALSIKKIFSNLKVRYDENRITPFANKLLQLFKNQRLFLPAGLLLNRKNGMGYGLAYKMEEDLEKILSDYTGKYFSKNSERLELAAKSFLASNGLEKKVTFLTMALDSSETENAPGANNVYCLKRHPMNGIIVPYYSQRGITISQDTSLTEYVKFYFLPFFYALFWSIGKIFRLPMKKDLIDNKNSIWIEYVQRGAVDYTFWLPKIKQGDFNIVFYFDRPDTPATKDVTDELSRRGFKWIKASTASLIIHSRFAFSEIKALFKMFLFCKNMPLIIRAFNFRLDFLRLTYESTYTRNKVKMLFQHQIYSWKQQAQADAIERSGGIMVGYNRSNFHCYPRAIQLLADHVYFVWGKALYEWAVLKGNTCKYILPSGLWLEPSIDKPVELASLEEGSKFRIAVFDSGYAYNVYQSQQNLEYFYLKIFDYLKKNKKISAIIKSKSWDDPKGFLRLNNGQEIYALAYGLEKEKRLVFLPSAFSPSTAAINADLSVCFGFNSAGIIAGIYGSRTIHWDCTGWLKYPLYRDNRQKIVFPDMDGFIEAIDLAVSGDKEIGDFSKWALFFNHFGDYNAADRVGKFIQDFMEEIARTKPNSNAVVLKTVVNRYTDNNNIDPRFFGDFVFWKEKDGKTYS